MSDQGSAINDVPNATHKKHLLTGSIESAMYSPGRFEVLIGVLFMIPGVITAVFVEEIPLQVLIDPHLIVTGIIGAFGTLIYSR